MKVTIEYNPSAVVSLKAPEVKMLRVILKAACRKSDAHEFEVKEFAATLYNMLK